MTFVQPDAERCIKCKIQATSDSPPLNANIPLSSGVKTMALALFPRMTVHSGDEERLQDCQMRNSIVRTCSPSREYARAGLEVA